MTHFLWEFGPYARGFPGPVKFTLNLDGEEIVDCKIEKGFAHKSLEKLLELQSWTSAIPFFDRIDPDGAVFGELVYCLSVEKLLGVEIPPRAQSIRILLSELTRVSQYLAVLSRFASMVKADTACHYILRDREKILDLMELLTGARFSISFLRIGGVAADITDGFLEKTLEVCDLLRVRIKEYNDILSFNKVFLGRTCQIGVLSKERAREFGITGPNAQASGVHFDVRDALPYSGYEKVDFTVPLGAGEFGKTGDVHDRVLLRLREILESVEIIKQIAESLEAGEFLVPVPRQFSMDDDGDVLVRVESSRGMLGCYLSAKKGGMGPYRAQIIPASYPSFAVLPELLRGARLEDIGVILTSLDLSMAEIDR